MKQYKAGCCNNESNEDGDVRFFNIEKPQRDQSGKKKETCPENIPSNEPTKEAEAEQAAPDLRVWAHPEAEERTG